MSRKFKLFALLLVFVVLGTTSTEVLAAGRRKFRRRPHREYSRHEREIELITPEEAKHVVRRQLGTHRVRFFGEPKLSNKADEYPVNGDYRPVYEMRCEAQGSKYLVDVDAVTGQVLKLAYTTIERHRRY